MDSNVKHSEQQSPQICVNDNEECHSRKRRSVRPPQKLRDYITNDDDPVIPDSNRNEKPIHKKELMRKQTSPKKVCKEVWLLDLLPYATYEYPSKVSKTNCPEKQIYIKEEPLDLDESELSPDDNSFCDYNVRDTYIKLEPESVIENSTSERIQMEVTESYETEELAPHGNVTPSVEKINKTPPQLKPKSLSSNKRRNNVKSVVTNELSVKDYMSVAKGNKPQSDANMIVTRNNRDGSGSVSKADYPPVKFRNSKTTGIDRRNKNYFHCYHCDYSTLSKSHLRIHVESVHLTLKQFCCPICPYRANQRAHLRQHVKAVHTKERPYPCNLCDYRATQKGHLRLHIDNVHEKFRPFGCNFCNFRSSLRCDLNRHVDDVHKKVKRFSCDICDYKCNRLRDIKKHMFRHEAVPLQQNEKTAEVKGVTKHSCDHCSFQTMYKNSLTCHIQSIHKNIKPYNCEFCEYKSSYRSALKMHVKSIHFGLKPFSCHLCGYKASLKYTIKMHILNVHKRVKPFSCHYCSYSVCKKHYLTKHIFSLHENDMLA